MIGRIQDSNPDRICLNCKHWQVMVQANGNSDGRLCRLGRGNTDSGDTCHEFSPASTFDSLHDPEKYHDRLNLH